MNPKHTRNAALLLFALALASCGQQTPITTEAQATPEAQATAPASPSLLAQSVGATNPLLTQDETKLTDLDGVKAVYPVMSVPLPQDQVVSVPDMSTAVAQTGADVAQNELGLTGKGVKIAIMDTGLDLDHPAFKGRVGAAYDLVGDAFDGTNTPVPGQDNVDDCAGHGTHVAGIAAGAGDLPGVAPAASLGIYRVFGCQGSTDSDIMIQAMERAQADGMDVLNMSIGASFNAWPEYPTAVAASNLVDAGVVVTASIGNSGSGEVWAAGAPGVGDKVIGVANFMNSHVYLNELTLSDGTKVGYQNATEAPVAPTTGSLPIAAVTPAIACDPLAAGSLAGRAALISRGTCTFYQKAINAQNAGASAVIIYNNASGPFAGTVAAPSADAPKITIPVVTISKELGVTILGKLPITLTWTDNHGSYVNPLGNTLDTSSSYGLSAELTFKPDLGAPGGLIRSTYPLSLGDGSGYATLSGTSMASPHVAGVSALVIEAKRKAGQGIRAEDMRTLLQNTASPKRWNNMPTGPYFDYVHRQGAGMVNVVNAVTTTTTVSPSKLSLGESEAGVPAQTLTLTNTGSKAVTYTVTHQGALTSTGSYAVKTYPSTATATLSTSTVTVPAGGSASVTVTIAPSGPDQSIYGGYIVFTAADGSPTLRVPYAGFQGDYQSLKILTIAPDVVRRAQDGSYTPAGNLTFSMQDEDYPYVRLHLDHFARWLKMEVLDAKTMQPVNSQFYTAATEEYLPRNSTATGFFTFGWDGQVSWSRGVSDNAQNKRKAVPNGQYIVKFTLLKALGDASNPAHLETWTSPVITVNT